MARRSYMSVTSGSWRVKGKGSKLLAQLFGTLKSLTWSQKYSFHHKKRGKNNEKTRPLKKAKWLASVSNLKKNKNPVHLLASQSIATNDGGRMNLLTHKFICSSKKFCSKYNYWGCSVSNFLVLKVCQLAENLGRRMLNFQQLQYCGSIICHSNILQKYLWIRPSFFFHSLPSFQGALVGWTKKKRGTEKKNCKERLSWGKSRMCMFPL